VALPGMYGGALPADIGHPGQHLVDGIDKTGGFLQKNSALTKWFRSRTENARGTRKPMIVALARKLLIAL